MSRGPVHIGFLASTLTTGGAEREIEHLVLHLDRARFAPRLYTLRAPGVIGEALMARGIPAATMLNPGRLPAPWFPLALARRFRRDGVRCLYALDHTNAVLAGVAAAGAAGGLPLIMPVHTMGLGGRPAVSRPIRAALRGITRLVAIAEAQRRYLVECEGLPGDRIAVIRNGIPVIDLTALPAKGEARAALDIAPDEGPVVGIVAMLRPEKGHEIFLDAARLVVAKQPRAVFLVAGDGPRAGELHALARDLGIAARVRFLGRRDDVPRVLRALDLSVLSSHQGGEALPISQMEAMSCEVPIVATRVGALHELVEDGVHGRLVPPGDPAALAAAIEELAGDPARREAAGRAARRRILAEFTIERAARETEALIASVMR